jgi:exodeoxyribonuclease VII large subunit
VTAHLLPVGVFVCLLRESFESDRFYADLWLEGEVSDLNRSPSGHVYFNLRDADGCLKCVLFRQQALRQPRLPRLGDEIVVHGGLSLYPRTGAMQLQVDLVRPAGLGARSIELEYLRLRLEAEGLFDPSRKRALPRWPKRIAVVTSPYGAAWSDIRMVIRRRYPLVELVLSPAQVQGDGAAESIAAALAALQHDTTIDTVIVARGGGGSDDLAAFNDERVVRAIFGCRAPVVAGIGHATDRSLAEDAADLVAPTPSAAAELSVPSVVHLAELLGSLGSRLGAAVAARHGDAASAAISVTRRLARTNPSATVHARRSAVSLAAGRIQAAGRVRVVEKRQSVEIPTTLLRALEPAAVLNRGYAVLQRADDRGLVTSVAAVERGVRVLASLRDGSFSAVVDAIPARASTPMGEP